MTIWYVDPIGGNDANAGTSFATRCQSITGINAKSAPTLGPNDTVRLIKSDDPVTTTMTTAAWTDGSKLITLAAPITQTVSLGNTAWTASANVTTSATTNRKYSTAGTQIAIAAAFTTGKTAYVATGALDLSGYQQISFWIYMASGATSADNDISLALCSDATGDVIVNNIAIPRIRATAGWNRVVVNTGAALGSNINSVALYVNQDRGAQTFSVNAIFASKAASDVDALTLSSLITPVTTSTGDWWSIEMIDGTTITLSQQPQFNLSQASVAQGYGSATGANATGIVRREPIILPSSLNEASASSGANWCNLSKTGTAGNPITFSGGWNATDMSTQTGDTYIAPYNGWGLGLTLTTYITSTNINPVRFNAGFYTNTSPIAGLTITATNVSGCANGVQSTQNASPFGRVINITNLIQNNVGSTIANGNEALGDVFNITNIIGNTTWGATFSGGYSSTNANTTMQRISFTSASIRRNGYTTATHTTAAGGLSMTGVTTSTFTLSYAGHNFGSNIFTGQSSGTSYPCSDNTFLFTNSSATQSLAVLPSCNGLWIGGGRGNKIYLMDQLTYVPLQISGGQYAIVNGGANDNTVFGGALNGTSSSVRMIGGTLHLQNTTSSSATVATLDTTNSVDTQLYWQAFNNVATDNRIYYNSTYIGSITTDTSIRHTASGVSWKMTQVGSTNALAPSPTYPMELPIGNVAVNAGSDVTASVWLYPTSVFQVVKLRCYYNNAGNAPFLYNETVVDLTGKTNTWFQTSITTTPTNAGVYSYSICVYGATSAVSLYVDDFSVGQV
jgi:hypothetical protein